MRLHIMSDLHVEFEDYDPPITDADVIILAGDIYTGIKGIEWAKAKFSKPVIYLLGNHEYYGHAWPKLIGKLKTTAEGSNIHVLENDLINIGDVTFLGCTLWTDFKMFGDPVLAGFEAMQCMNDYKKIRRSPEYSRLRSIDTATIHQKSMLWMKKQLKEYQDKKIVIITHHAPSKQSVPSYYQDNRLSAAFGSSLDDFVDLSNAKLWIHGHMHNNSDYIIGNTRVICNPKGYPDENNDDFIPDLVVEI